MSDAEAQQHDRDLVEAFAKQLFRAENRPDLLWDTKMFERAGRSTEGLEVADDVLKESYRRRAAGMLSGGS